MNDSRILREVSSKKRELENRKAITIKNGEPAAQRVRPACDTKMFGIGKG